MMSRLTWLLSIAAVAAALPGCGGDHSGDDRRPAATPRTATTPAKATPEREPPARDLDTVDLQGVAVGHDGSIFAADAANSRILRIDRRGRITDFAGEPGFHGLTGDGGAGSEAHLRAPTGLAVDHDNNLYITDHGNHRIRKVDRHGTITTIAGSGPEGSGSGSFSGDGGPATRARLQEPVAVSVDAAGRLYIADRDNYRVREVDVEGSIRTLAGSGDIGPEPIDGPAAGAALGLPVGVAAARDGSVYISDEPAHRVYKVDEQGLMTTFAGTGKAGFRGDGGPATKAELNGPYGLATDARGNLYIADAGNNAIRVVNRAGTIRTVAGKGPGGRRSGKRSPAKGELNEPYAVAVDPVGALYIADTRNGRVLRVDPDGAIRTLLP